MTTTISITDKGKTITYHAHHMRDVIEPVKLRTDFNTAQTSHHN